MLLFCRGCVRGGASGTWSKYWRGSVGISSSQLSPAAEVLFPRPAHRCGQSADSVVAGPLGPHTRPSPPDPKSRRPGDRGELQQSTSPRPRPKTQPPHSPTHPLTLFSALQGEILRQQLHPQPTRIAQPPVPLPPPSSIVSWPLFPCSRSSPHRIASLFGRAFWVLRNAANRDPPGVRVPPAIRCYPHCKQSVGPAHPRHRHTPARPAHRQPPQTRAQD